MYDFHCELSWNPGVAVATPAPYPPTTTTNSTPLAANASAPYFLRPNSPEIATFQSSNMILKINNFWVVMLPNYNSGSLLPNRWLICEIQTKIDPFRALTKQF